MPSFTTTSCRDRTSEFQQLTERLQKQQVGPSTSTVDLNGHHHARSKPSTSGSHFAPQSEFAQRASRIGLQIHGTTQKLQKLAQLAKRTSKFDDPAQEIGELTLVIKQDIQQLNASISELQSVSHQGWDGNRQSSVHSEKVVDNLRARLKDTTSDFKDVLTLRSEKLKAYQDRRSIFSSDASGLGSKALGVRPSLRNSQTSLFGNAAKGDIETNGEAGASNQTQPLLQQQQQQLAQPQDTYLSSRAEALQNVEKTIHELGTIFQQLAELVQAQEEVVVRIDENVEDTLQNVDAAQTYLLKYLRNISSNRWLVLKVFFVLLLFLVVFLVFVA